MDEPSGVPPRRGTAAGPVTLPDPVHAELARHMEAWPGNETVSSSPNGDVPRATSRRRRFWHPAVEKGESRPLDSPTLRHTAIAFWIGTGANLLEVSRRLAIPVRPSLSTKYGQLFPEADSEVSGRLSGFYVVRKAVGDDDGAEEK